jgi:hypothetical protein
MEGVAVGGSGLIRGGLLDWNNLLHHFFKGGSVSLHTIFPRQF